MNSTDLPSIVYYIGTPFLGSNCEIYHTTAPDSSFVFHIWSTYDAACWYRDTYTVNVGHDIQKAPIIPMISAVASVGRNVIAVDADGPLEWPQPERTCDLLHIRNVLDIEGLLIREFSSGEPNVELAAQVFEQSIRDNPEMSVPKYLKSGQRLLADSLLKVQAKNAIEAEAARHPFLESIISANTCVDSVADHEPCKDVKRTTLRKEVQREVWRRDRGQCVECGSKENLEFDHVIPVSRGGANTVRNIQLLCEACNRRKADRTPGSY